MNLITVPISIASAGDNTVIAAVATASYRIRRLFLTNTPATVQAVTIKDGASVSLTGAMQMQQIIGSQLNFGDNQDSPLFKTERGNAFIINLLSATNVAGFVSYTVE